MHNNATARILFNAKNALEYLEIFLFCILFIYDIQGTTLHIKKLFDNSTTRMHLACHPIAC